MEVRVRERLIGALVLVGIVVLLVPAILTGGPQRKTPAPPPAETQSVQVDLDAGLPPADADVLIPEPQSAATGALHDAMPIATAPAAQAAPAPSTPSGASPRGEESQVSPVAEARAAAGASTGPAAWAVQLGAFSNPAKAEQLVARLRARGYAAFVLEYRASGQVLHRVRVGPEQDRARAVAIAERLRKDGFQPVVAPHP